MLTTSVYCQQSNPKSVRVGTHRLLHLLDVLPDDGFHLLDLLTGLALRGGDLDIRYLHNVVSRLGGFVFTLGPFFHFVNNELLFAVRDLRILGSTRNSASNVVFGTVVDSPSEYIGCEQKDGEDEDFEAEHVG